MHKIIFTTKVGCIAVFLFAFTLFASAQELQWQWAVQGHGIKSDAVSGMVCDSLGNVYIAGSFSDTISFDNFQLGANGQSDIFLVKYDKDGAIQWAKTAGGNGKDYPTALAITCGGKIYMAGMIGQQALFEGAATGKKKQNLFIASYSGEGDLIWVRSYDAIPADYITSICTDDQGNGYFGGYFEKQLTLDEYTIAAAHKTDAFICRIDSTGEIHWVNQWGGKGIERITGLHFSGNRLWITGTCQSVMEIDAFVITPSDKQQSAFIAVCNPEGEVIHAQKIADSKQLNPAKIKQLTNGNLIIGGSFSDSLHTVINKVYTHGNQDIFVLMTDTSGRVLWQEQIGSYGFDKLFDVIEYPSAGIILTGMYSGTLFLNNDTTSFHSSHGDLFNLSLNYEGEQQWISTTRGKTEQYPIALTSDPSGNVYITGAFRDTLKIRKSILQAPKGAYNVFFAKLYNCQSHTLTFLCDTVFTEGTSLPIEVEGGYTAYKWNEGLSTAPIYTVSCSGVYTVEVKDSLNCIYTDSIAVRQVPAKPVIQIRAEVLPAPCHTPEQPGIAGIKPEETDLPQA